ncbi:hypothetical protein IM538_13150 [Cytobacillus suaedae]|nr:hypothetical protein IM538_13150 [Cytobacillus suaedae]
MKSYWFILLLAVLLVGCKKEVTEEAIYEKNNKSEFVNREVEFINSSIKVEENTSLGYKELRVIEDAQELKQLEDILDRLTWVKAKVEMSSPPHFRFISEDVYFAMWVTPKKDHIEMIVEGENLYQVLSKQDSNLLFKLLTDKKLSDYDKWY